LYNERAVIRSGCSPLFSVSSVLWFSLENPTHRTTGISEMERVKFAMKGGKIVRNDIK